MARHETSGPVIARVASRWRKSKQVRLESAPSPFELLELLGSREKRTHCAERTGAHLGCIRRLLGVASNSTLAGATLIELRSASARPDFCSTHGSGRVAVAFRLVGDGPAPAVGLQRR